MVESHIPSTSGFADELLSFNNIRNISQRVINLRGRQLKSDPNMQLSLVSKEYSPGNMIIPSYSIINKDRDNLHS